MKLICIGIGKYGYWYRKGIDIGIVNIDIGIVNIDIGIEKYRN